MTGDLPDYNDLVRVAVGSYWNVRQSQAKRSRAQGVLNTGTRAEVTGGRHLDTPWSHHPGISARPWVDDPTLARGWIETGSPPLGPAFARAPKIPPARPLGREPNEFSQPHAPRVVFSDSSTTLRGKSSSHSPRWPPESAPGFLDGHTTSRH